jgi:hypothetical protein
MKQAKGVPRKHSVAGTSPTNPWVKIIGRLILLRVWIADNMMRCMRGTKDHERNSFAFRIVACAKGWPYNTSHSSSPCHVTTLRSLWTFPFGIHTSPRDYSLRRKHAAQPTPCCRLHTYTKSSRRATSLPTHSSSPPIQSAFPIVEYTNRSARGGKRQEAGERITSTRRCDQPARSGKQTEEEPFLPKRNARCK